MVLLENTPLVKIIRNCIRDLSGVFSISWLVKMSMTSFPAFSLVFVCGWLFVYITKRALHVSSKIWILCSSGKNDISLVRCAHIKFISLATNFLTKPLKPRSTSKHSITYIFLTLGIQNEELVIAALVLLGFVFVHILFSFH